MRAALERRNASTMIISSIRGSLVGAHVDCSTKTSLPRTFSSSSTITSPSLNCETVALPSWMFSCRATDCASFGLALPVNTIRLSKAMSLRRCGSRCMAGEEGFEPSNAGIKIRCLNQLGDSPTLLLLPAKGMHQQSLRHETLHRCGHLPRHRLRVLARAESREDTRPGTGHPRRRRTAKPRPLV